jgi:hypothetical protein
VIAQQPDTGSSGPPTFRILPATPADIPGLHALVRALAEYEHLSDICTSTQADLQRALFGERPVA